MLDLNATQAAVRAGYSGRNPHQLGYQLLQNPLVQEALSSALEARSARTGVTQDRVLEELAKIAFSDLRKVVTWGPDGVEIKESEELTDFEAGAVSEVAETPLKDGGKALRIKLYGKQAALDLLAKHLKMFGGDHDNLAQAVAKAAAVVFVIDGQSKEVSEMTSEELDLVEGRLKQELVGHEGV